ncbi:MAG TPA: reverse transcriptase domain-containing protein [Polyangiaceae bacterium]|nr:reverse transcriptase domain-containing protein [Polyangiaceae bacterium]
MKPANVSTKQRRIADLARTNPKMAFTSLNHHLDEEWLRYAYELTRKDGATGIDGRTAADYEANLEENLRGLLGRIKSGRYYAPPVRAATIPKADGTARTLGIPTFEDKVAQRAIVLLLEPLYEQDFLPCSYGSRPGRSAHQSLRDLRSAIMERGLRWLLDVDLRTYFDTIDHGHLRTFLARRVADGVVRTMIDKWLKAGVLDEGQLRRSDVSTPQGGVISPLLANVYLHYVLDEWFAAAVGPRMNKRHVLVRFCDDFVLAFEDFLDDRRVFEVLGKRVGRFGLALHPDKTRLATSASGDRTGGTPPRRRRRSTSSALPTCGASRGGARTSSTSGRRRLGTRGRCARSMTGARSIGIGLCRSSIGASAG